MVSTDNTDVGALKLANAELRVLLAQTQIQLLQTQLRLVQSEYDTALTKYRELKGLEVSENDIN